MKLKMYQVDAFTSNIFSGNPAAVCILDHWIDDALMQNIANPLLVKGTWTNEAECYSTFQAGW